MDRALPKVNANAMKTSKALHVMFKLAHKIVNPKESEEVFVINNVKDATALMDGLEKIVHR